MKDYNKELSPVLVEALETFKQAAAVITDNWQTELDADYPFDKDFAVIVEDLNLWGMPVDIEEERRKNIVEYKVITIDEDLPLVKYVGKIISLLDYNSEIEIGGSDRYNYTVEDVLQPIEQLLRNGEYDFDAYKSVYVDHILIRIY